MQRPFTANALPTNALPTYVLPTNALPTPPRARAHHHRPAPVSLHTRLSSPPPPPRPLTLPPPSPPRIRPLIRRLAHELSPLEAEVLSLRYGLGDGAALSWKQIAARCDLPEKQAQLAQSRALRKLRKQRSLRQLQAFCDHEEWEHQGRMSPGESYSTR